MPAAATISPPPAEPPAEPPADQNLADQLLGTMATLRRTGRRLAGRPELLSTLTGAQSELVRLVRRRPGVSVAEAAEELRLAPNTVSTLVSRLTDRGVMVRLPDPADRRVARLELHPDTRRKVTAWRDRRVLTLTAAIDELDPADRQALVRAVEVLDRLTGAWERQGAAR